MTTTLIPEHKVKELEAILEPLPGVEDVNAKLEASMSYSLSDAIREGATATEQMTGGWVSDDGEKMCALSAALLAVKARHFI